MEFLHGENLEIALRTENKRKNAVDMVNRIFQYLYNAQIYWGDFAPRNIIIDKNNSRINICDFERGIQHNILNKEYLQNYVYEEYAAFLFPYERKFSEGLNQIFTVETCHSVNYNEIKSNRVKNIIRVLGLPLTNLTNQTVANINKMIVLAETPYKRNDKSIFPIVELEQIKDQSYTNFAQKVCQILKEKGSGYGNIGRIQTF